MCVSDGRVVVCSYVCRCVSRSSLIVDCCGLLVYVVGCGWCRLSFLLLEKRVDCVVLFETHVLIAACLNTVDGCC